MADESHTGVLDEKNISERIHEFIVTKLLAGEDPINLTSTTPLISGGIIDSVNSMKVGLFLEKSFSIHILPEELSNPENLETIEAMTRLVTLKKQA